LQSRPGFSEPTQLIRFISDENKIYAESFKGIEHLRQLQEEAQKVVNDAIG